MKRMFGQVVKFFGCVRGKAVLSFFSFLLSWYFFGRISGLMSSNKVLGLCFCMLTVWSFLAGVIFMSVVIIWCEEGLRPHWHKLHKRIVTAVVTCIEFTYAVHYSTMIKPKIWVMNGFGLAFLCAGFVLSVSCVVGVVFGDWSLSERIPKVLQVSASGITALFFGAMTKCLWQLIKRQAYYDWNSFEPGAR